MQQQIIVSLTSPVKLLFAKGISPASVKDLLLFLFWVLASTRSLATVSRDTKLLRHIFGFESSQYIKCSHFICKSVGLWKDEHQLISGLL